MAADTVTVREQAHRTRVALYSHDTMGLGHARRNHLIAQALAGDPLEAQVLLVSGAQTTSSFGFPAGVDCVTLPALAKGPGGSYGAKTLDVGLSDLLRLRSETIDAALKAFSPDVLIVDKVPFGALDELLPVLWRLRREGVTRCILGLRDVLDDPATVWRELCDESVSSTIEELYDGIWVYGDPRVYALDEECGLPQSLRAMLSYVGYLDPRQRLWRNGLRAKVPTEPLALCLVGGGQDGERVADAFARAEPPADMRSLLVTGPFLPESARRRLLALARERERLEVVEFLAEPAEVIARASRVVAMGGYNTITEMLAFEVPALIVPRVRPRSEQLIRAERLDRLGLLQMLHPDRLTTEALERWLHAPRARPRVHPFVDMSGLERIPRLVRNLTKSGQQPARLSPTAAGAAVPTAGARP